MASLSMAETRYASTAPEARVRFIGTPMDILNMEQTVSTATDAMRYRTKTYHVALNAAKLVKMRSDAELAADVSAADIIGIDGMGIVFGARLCRMPVPERVGGIDLMEALLAECARQRFRPYFLGATEEVVKAAGAAMVARHPGLEIAGMRNGYFKLQDHAAIVADINQSGADCLFVGMPTPQKERFLAANRSRIDAPFIMGVGGSFDVFSGKVRRAPQWVQHWGLEWAYRVYQEPRRMFWRYASTNVTYAGLLLAEIWARRLRPAYKIYSSRVIGALASLANATPVSTSFEPFAESVRSDPAIKALYAYVRLESRIAKTHPLRIVRGIARQTMRELHLGNAEPHDRDGREAIPTEKLLLTELLAALYSLSTPAVLMENLEYHLLFRWFVGLDIGDTAWDARDYEKQRADLLGKEPARKFLDSVLGHPSVLPLLHEAAFAADTRKVKCADAPIFDTPLRSFDIKSPRRMEA